MGLNSKLYELRNKFGNLEPGSTSSDVKDYIINSLSSIEQINSKEDAIAFLELLSLCRTAESKMNGKKRMRTITNVFSGGEEGVYVDNDNYINDRFIYELVQNVDDCNFEDLSNCTLNIEFDFEFDKLTLKYNESGFEPKNVIAISDLGGSTKNHDKTNDLIEKGLDKKDLQEIGEKGIGFKSIFGLANKVTIKSGYFNFSFLRDDILIPIIEDYNNFSKIQGTILEIFLDKGITEKLYNFLKDKYQKESAVINENPILFLNKLTELKYSSKDAYFGFKTSRNMRTDEIVGELTNIEYISSNGNKTYECYRYCKNITYSIDECRSRYGIDENKERHHKIEILTSANLKDNFKGRIYSFFPTEQELDVPMIIHSPFKLNSARTNIANQSATADGGNLWFDKTKKETISFIQDSLEDLAKKIGFKIVNFIPEDNLVCNIKCPLYDDSLSRNEILKLRLFNATNGLYLPAAEICILRKNNISLIDSKIIHNLLKINTPLLNEEPKNNFKNYYGFQTINDIDNKLFLLSLTEVDKIKDCLKYLNEYTPKNLSFDKKIFLNMTHIREYCAFPNIITFINQETIKNINKEKSIVFEFSDETERFYDNNKIKEYTQNNKENIELNLHNYIVNSNYVKLENINDYIYLSNCVMGTNIVDSYNNLCKISKSKSGNFFAFLKFDEYEKDINSLFTDVSISEHSFLNNLIEHRKLQKSILNNQYEGVLEIIKKAGTKPKRFLAELLQNIDDCCFNDEPFVEITTEDNKLTIEYNEVGFTKENVAAITAIGDSTKKYISSNEITGEKGIGFKSIFNVANAVSIHSGKFHFVLNSNEPTIPIKLQNFGFITGTKMIFDLNNGIIDQFFDSEELCMMALCLKKIKTISINGKMLTIKDSKNKREIELEKKYSFYKFNYDYLINDEEVLSSRYKGIKADRQQRITFLIPKEELNNYLVYSTFPTTSKLNVPLIIDANFDLNSSRESILEDSIWNKFTAHKINEGYLSMLEEMKSVNYNTMQHLIPLDNQIFSNDIWNDDIIDKIKHLNIFKIFKTKSFTNLYNGILGEEIEKYIISKWGCYNKNNKHLEYRENLIDLDLNLFKNSNFLEHRNFIDVCKDIYSHTVYNALRKDNLEDSKYRNMLYKFLKSYNIKEETDEDYYDEHYIPYNIAEEIKLLEWKIIPILGKGKVTYSKFNSNIYYNDNNEFVDSSKYKIIDTSIMSKNTFHTLFYDADPDSYINLEKYTKEKVSEDFFEQMKECLNCYTYKEKAENLLKLYNSDKELFENCINTRRDFNTDRVCFETKSGDYKMYEDCYYPSFEDESNTILDNVVVSERYVELAKLLQLSPVSNIDSIENLSCYFDYDSLMTLTNLKCLENNDNIFNEIFESMFYEEYNECIENDLFLKLFNRITKVPTSDQFNDVTTWIDSNCILNYGNILNRIFKLYSNYKFKLSSDVVISEFENYSILNDIKNELQVRKENEKILIANSLIDNCYYCKLKDCNVVPIKLNDKNILLIKDSIVAEYDVITTLKKFFLENFSLSLDISRDAERYTRDGYESISTLDYEENDVISAEILARNTLDFNNVSMIKDFMCKPLRINGKVFGGYAKKCPICGSLILTELTGMRLYKVKQNDVMLEIISCPNCYENLRYVSGLEFNLDDLYNDLLSFKGIVNGENWIVEKKKIRLGHKAILNIRNQK